MDKQIMTTGKSIFVIILLALGVQTAAAQVHVAGALNAQVYARENAAQNQQSDFYQGLTLRLTPVAYPDLSLRTHLRVARRGDPADWDERIYNGYLQWRSSGRRIALRLGRQFVHDGVINGTVDGVHLTARPAAGLEIRFVGGGDAPMSREFDVQDWDSSHVFGGFVSYRRGREAKIDFSYFERSRRNVVVWQQFGSALSGWLKKELFYNAQLDYNLLKEEVQGMRYRLIYTGELWGGSAEFNSQKPRIYEDSYFNIFKLSAYNQFRLGVTRRLGQYQIGVQERWTQYDDDSGSETVVTASAAWGSVGFILQNGFGGDNVGVFGEVRRKLITNLELRVRSSHYRFERHSVQINEEATAFSGGLHFRPAPAWWLRAELQQRMNSGYKNDLRGLLGISYSFNRAIR